MWYPRPMRMDSQAQVAAVLLASSASLFSGCASAPPMERFVALSTHSPLSIEASVTMQQLVALEGLLQSFEEMRVAAVSQYGFLLLIPAVSERYERAVHHHRDLCREVCERKKQVALGVCDSELCVIGEWCLRQERALMELKDTVKFLEEHHRVPRGWSPPEGFEYLAFNP